MADRAPLIRLRLSEDHPLRLQETWDFGSWLQDIATIASIFYIVRDCYPWNYQFQYWMVQSSMESIFDPLVIEHSYFSHGPVEIVDFDVFLSQDIMDHYGKWIELDLPIAFITFLAHLRPIPQDTGGTCSWFGCSKSRGADPRGEKNGPGMAAWEMIDAKWEMSTYVNNAKFISKYIVYPLMA